jgi:hypothetical protein
VNNIPKFGSHYWDTPYTDFKKAYDSINNLVALQSLKDPGLLTYRRFLELFRHMVGLLGRVISPSQGLYLHRTTQHRKTRDKYPCLERDSNPRSQQPIGQDPRLRPHGHCDRHSVYGRASNSCPCVAEIFFPEEINTNTKLILKQIALWYRLLVFSLLLSVIGYFYTRFYFPPSTGFVYWK